MRILDLRREETDGGARVSADIVWEDVPRPPQRIAFEVDGLRPDELVAAHDAFLVACLPPALRNGERRIRFEEGAVCPRLFDGVLAAAKLLRTWYGPPRRVLDLEARRQAPPGRRDGAISFLTGGIDSTFTLRRNHLALPAGHAERIARAVVISGLFALEADSTALAAEFAGRCRRAAEGVAAAAGIPLTVVRTNVRDLEPAFEFFAFESHGSILAAVAHLLAGHAGSARIAASITMRGLRPHGIHPVLDALWSSSRMRITHDGFGFGRLAKARAIAPWHAAVGSLMFCQAGPVPDGSFNCGRCEKCQRSHLEMLVAGAPVDLLSFASRDISPAAIRRRRIEGVQIHFWRELQTELRARGDRPLARAIAFKILGSRLTPRRGLPVYARYRRSAQRRPANVP